MKIKKLIWALAVVLGITACTSEMPVENKDRVGLSVMLSVGRNETKAVGGDVNPYFEEVQVSRYHVAIFEGDKRIAHGEYGLGLSQGLQVVDGTEGISIKYKAHFEDIPEGSVSVYVIANYPSDWNFDDVKWGSFAGYQKESVITELFKAEELVKVGYKTFPVTSTTTQLELSLVQLTAGIDLLLKQAGEVDPVEDPDKSEYVFLDASEEKVYDITNEQEVEENIGFEIIKSTISRFLEIRSPEYRRASELITDGDWNKNGKDWFGKNDDKVYEKLQPENGVLYFRAYVKDGNKFNDYVTDFKIVAYGRDVDCDVKVPVTGLLTGKTSLSGLNKESDIAIFSKEGPENTKYEALTMSSFNTRFYTYEPKNDLTLNVEVGTGTNKNVYRKKYRQYGYKIYRGRWINEPKDHSAYDWKGGEGKFPVDAWLEVTKGGHVIDEGSKTPIRTETGNGELTNVKTYSLTIPGSTITKGHVYQVIGKYNSSVSGNIEWQVADWTTNHTINIGFGQ